MPVAAARQAEVGAADPDPAVLGGRGEHGLDQLAVGLLEGVALGERSARLGDAGRERVADALESAEVEYPRRSGGTDPVGHVHTAEALADQPGELGLEPADLAPQLDPGTQLIGGRGSYTDVSDGVPIDLSSVEQIRHRPILSPLHRRRRNP